MKIKKEKIKGILDTVNFDGLRCVVKGDPSIREINGALKRQKEIEDAKNKDVR